LRFLKQNSRLRLAIITVAIEATTKVVGKSSDSGVGVGVGVGVGEGDGVGVCVGVGSGEGEGEVCNVPRS
jgi:hypothetical protein